MSDRILNLAHAAAYLDVPERRLRDHWRRWEIPVYKVGRELRFRLSDLEAWLNGQRVSG
jgi:excisionase family DNA binding protein